MTSPSTPVSDQSTALPFQLFRALGYLVLLLMLVACLYAAFIIMQNWSVISV